MIFRLLEKHDAKTCRCGGLLLGAVLAARTTTGLAVAGLIGYRVATPARVFVAVCVLGLLLWVRRRWYAVVVRSARFVLLLLGFAIFWMLPELVYMAVKPEPHDVASFSRTASQNAMPERRIVWVLFDELVLRPGFRSPAPAIFVCQILIGLQARACHSAMSSRWVTTRS